MSQWKEYKLGDLCAIFDGPHATPPKQKTGNIFLGISSLGFDGRIDSSFFEYISDEHFTRWTKRVEPSENDIVFSYETKLGVAAIIPKGFKCALGRRMGLLRVKANVNPKILLYAFLAPSFQSVIYERTYHGSTVDRIPLKELGQFPILLPPLSQQKAIASILSSLDDKIDLLHRQNTTLEKMAETLFRKWFVEEAKEEWENGSLIDVLELIYGKALKEEIRTGTGYPVVGSSGIVGYHSEYLVEGPGIVIGRKGTLGKVNYLFDNFFPIDTTYFIKSKNDSEGLFYEYFLLKSMNFEEMNSDSAVPGLNRDIALSTEIKVPPFKRVKEFNKYCSSLFDKLKANQTQIRTLTTLRDNLLPKLMSGEVKVQAKG